MSGDFSLEVGVKTDPIEYRYSFEWLFRIVAAEGVRHLQLGTFCEVYQLPDEFFRDLRRRAEDHGLSFTSIFTAHRELGGFFREDGPGWVQVARRNYQRLIEVGALLGASSVGSNPGAIMRDRMGTKAAGTKVYLQHMKELMRHAADRGVMWLTVEPMSCLAEPPTLPGEMREMAEELAAHHAANPTSTASFGFCIDVAHGYADSDKKIVHSHEQLLEAALPWTSELHLKNTDALYNSTFGFMAAERGKGIISIADVRDFLLARVARLPVKKLIGYLEVGGPKTGRDYTDGNLEMMLRESLQHVKETFVTPGGATVSTAAPAAPAIVLQTPRVQLAPSIMCADQCHLEEEVRRLEAAGADMLHFDLMDAHFTPNMPLGLVMIEQLRAKTALPFDVHLMVDNNDFFIRELAKLGVQQISVHVESSRHLDRTVNLIRGAGMKAGVAINPATPLSAIDYVLESLDFVLLMTVNPGFAGQKLVASALRKIADCRRFLDERGLDLPIEVDGNVSFENIPKMVAAGADILVCGSSSMFHRAGTLQENTRKTHEAAGRGLEMRPGAAMKTGAVKR